MHTAIHLNGLIKVEYSFSKLLLVLLSVLSIVWRRRPATGGVLPGWRPTEPAGERLLPALQTGVQPELPGRRLPLSVPVARRRLADGKLRKPRTLKHCNLRAQTSSFATLVCDRARMNPLCHVC